MTDQLDIECDLNSIQTELGFCTCGNAYDNLRYIRDGLAHIDSPRPEGNNEWDKWYKQWLADGIALFGNERARYFFFYWADAAELTEHGGSVPGWLTDKGHDLLSCLKAKLEAVPND